MRNIILIGNSNTHAAFIEELRRHDKQSSITLVSDDVHLPYRRQSVLQFLSGELKERQTHSRPDGFYKQNNVRVILGQPVARVNFKRSQVVLENKEQLSYDVLVLSDVAAPRLPEIKGHNKLGVFNAVRLSAVKEIIDQLVFTQTVVVQLTTWHGFLTLCALSNSNKEIVAVTSDDVLFPEILDQESSSILKQLLEYKGVRLMVNNPIEEILGDSDLKAVRLKSGKVLSAEMVVLDDLRADTRIFKEAGLEFSQTGSDPLNVRSQFPNVYWTDALRHAYAETQGSDYQNCDDALERQGKTIAQNVQEIQEVVSDGNAIITKFSIKDIQGVCFGLPQTGEGAQAFSRFDPQTNTYMKIFTKEGIICAGILLNGDKAAEKIIELYVHKTNVHGREETLLHDQVSQEVLADVQQQG